jgi:prevent-host-death family protein
MILFGSAQSPALVIHPRSRSSANALVPAPAEWVKRHPDRHAHLSTLIGTGNCRRRLLRSVYYISYYTLVMDRIPIRSLNQDTAGVLARVEQGETVEITNRGRLVARIVPVGVDPLDELVNTGAITPPIITLPFAMPTGVPVADQDAGELISGLRDEERW